MNMHNPFSEATEAPDHGVVMPPSEQSDTAENQVCKTVRHQVLDKHSYKADALRATLKQRASKPGSAKYLGNISVDTISIEGDDEGKRVRFDRNVVRCKQCGQAHGGSTVNPPIFAISHFSDHTTNPICKKTAAKEAHVAKALNFGQQPAGPMDLYVVDAKRMNEAMHELAMSFVTSNTPPERVENVHLKKSFALLGSQTPVQGICALAT
jgi:hypothetical protein